MYISLDSKSFKYYSLISSGFFGNFGNITLQYVAFVVRPSPSMGTTELGWIEFKIEFLMVAVITSANLNKSPSFWIFMLGIAIFIFSNMTSVALWILRQQNSTVFALSLYYRRTFSKVPSSICKNLSYLGLFSTPWYYNPWDGASAIKKQQSKLALNDSSSPAFNPPMTSSAGSSPPLASSSPMNALTSSISS